MNLYKSSFLGNVPEVVKNIIIINVIMYFATFVLQNSFGIDLVEHLALYNIKSVFFKPYQIVTHLFMHGGLMHIFFNMLALYMFGRMLEMVWGPKRFLIYYFFTGLGAAALHLLVSAYTLHSYENAISFLENNPTPDVFSNFIKENVPSAYLSIFNDVLVQWINDPHNRLHEKEAVYAAKQLYEIKMNIPTVGASGAVFGILLAFGMLFPNTELLLLFPPIPIKAKYFVIIYGIIELFLGFRQNPSDNVAHFAHVGGMLFGFILLKIWQKKSKHFY